MDKRNRSKLLDVREQRKIAQPFEFREDKDGQVAIEGYAATYEPYDCYGGPDRGGWVEQLSRASFKRTLNEDPDVMLLVNHEGLPLARTKSGTLKLMLDNHGLRMRAMLDPTDPDVQAIVPKMRRGDLNEMSFSFRVKDQVWNTEYTHRNITELSLQKGDVSVVNYGMNPNTRVVLADAVGALASMSPRQLAEVRSMDPVAVRRAMSVLQEACEAREVTQDKETVVELPPNEANISHIESVRKFDGGLSLVAVMNDGSKTPLPSMPAQVDAYVMKPMVEPVVTRADEPEKDEDEEEMKTISRAEFPMGDDDEDEESCAEGCDKEHKHARSDDGDADDEKEDEDEDEFPFRSVSDRLKELRKEDELPDLPSISDALDFIRNL